jgi:hypothetical protein
VQQPEEIRGRRSQAARSFPSGEKSTERLSIYVADSMQVLLSAGSNRGAKDEKGRSAADLAKECGHKDIENWLTVTPGK